MTDLIPSPQNEPAPLDRLAEAGRAASAAAAKRVFQSYQEGKSAQTRRRQSADLACFAEFLRSVTVPAGDLEHDPAAWRGVTWGLVEAFKQWMLAQGYAVSSLNVRLSTVKTFAKLAAKAGAIEPSEASLISLVAGFSHKESRHVDERREEAGGEKRRGTKKAAAVAISPEQAKALKTQPDTPQGRRDALLMCLLLDHGLRCGEAALLRVEYFQFTGLQSGLPRAGYLTFLRPKVAKEQTHRLTADTLAAAWAYLKQDQPMQAGPLFLATRKGGALASLGMSERAITKRVAALGKRVGLVGLSAHDCRHYWATDAARNHTPLDRLMDAGGWSSPAMPMRYIERAKVANEGVKLTGG